MKEKKGISLIVLIVTIIVMIIIAGAVIISLTETNIIDQAETAVEKHNESEIQIAANMAYSNWLLEEKTGKNPGHVQNYIRNELIRQNVATWDDFSKWYITHTGKIEEVDTEALIVVVEIPEDNTYVQIHTEQPQNIVINWGDNTRDTNEYYDDVEHTYTKKGKYIVSITGKCGYFSPTDMEKYIVEIKSFGNLGVDTLAFFESSKVKYISMPNEKSFENLESFFIKAENVEELPAGMFKNCKKLKEVNIVDCKNLKYIPLDIFDGCDALQTINIEGCTSLENYDALPEEWK